MMGEGKLKLEAEYSLLGDEFGVRLDSLGL
jgi:hypothetical protein